MDRQVTLLRKGDELIALAEKDYLDGHNGRHTRIARQCREIGEYSGQHNLEVPDYLLKAMRDYRAWSGSFAS